MEWYETKRCRSWGDFLEKIRKLPAMFYRGEASNKQQLESTFDRAVNAAQRLKKARWLYEVALLRDFRRRAHHYSADTPEKNDLLEWLALMRHYGAPTRLVDFTYSQFIAAYFAFSDLGQESRVVWAIDRDWLTEEANRHCLEILDRSEGSVDLHCPTKFTKCFLDPDRKTGSSRRFVSAVNAERMNTRLTIQQGLFLCPGDVEQSFEKNLEGMVSKKKKSKPVLKFVVPHTARAQALTELKYMNISSASLFPDLSGLAKSLNDRFELLFKDYDVREGTLKAVVAWYRANDKAN